MILYTRDKTAAITPCLKLNINLKEEMKFSLSANTKVVEKNKILAIFAHPDDEVFRCGGTLSLLAKSNVSVHILTFTQGQAGSCGNPPICTKSDLGIVRARELTCSCQALGLEAPNILGYEDGRLQNVSQEEGVAEIVLYIKKFNPQIVLTWPPDGLSDHPDHIAVSQWTSEAFRHIKNEGIEELKSLYYLTVPQSLANDLGMKQLHTIDDSEVTVTINVQSVWNEKMTAISCHKSQAGESPIMQAPIEKQIRFLGFEHFYRAYSCQSEDVLLNLSLDFKETKKNR
jgi:LmbE family N-acetylglucosaminyl deacetylase